MTLFLIALAILVGGYFIYGTLMERVIGCDPLREMPCYTKQDGVDYIPMATWRVFRACSVSVDRFRNNLRRGGA